MRVKVAAATHDAQAPWESSSLTGAFYFTPVAPVAANHEAQAAETAEKPTKGEPQERLMPTAAR